METLDNEVRNRLYEIIEGASSVEEFEAWFVGRTWDERTPFIASIDHLLAERSLLDDSHFAEELRTIATTIAYTDIRLVTTSAITETLRPDTIHVGGTETIRRRLEVAGT